MMGTTTTPKNLVAVARILAAMADDLRGGNPEERAVSCALQAVRVGILTERTLTLAAHLEPWMVALQAELERENAT
jgi:hypothetical protein